MVLSPDVYAKMVLSIIDEQEKIIGPIAYQQANNIRGLHVDKAHHTAELEGDGVEILTQLINKYKSFFGNVAVDVCKEAIGDLKFSVPPEQLPAMLR